MINRCKFFTKHYLVAVSEISSIIHNVKASVYVEVVVPPAIMALSKEFHFPNRISVAYNIIAIFFWISSYFTFKDCNLCSFLRKLTLFKPSSFNRYFALIQKDYSIQLLPYILLFLHYMSKYTITKIFIIFYLPNKMQLLFLHVFSQRQHLIDFTSDQVASISIKYSVFLDIYIKFFAEYIQYCLDISFSQLFSDSIWDHSKSSIRYGHSRHFCIGNISSFSYQFLIFIKFFILF